MISPGVQKPHCTAPDSTKACCTSLGEPSGAMPSMVTISWPTADAASTRQLQTSSPSMITLHDPHSPCSHAPLLPEQPEPLAQHVQQALADPGVADLVRHRR